MLSNPGAIPKSLREPPRPPPILTTQRASHAFRAFVLSPQVRCLAVPSLIDASMSDQGQCLSTDFQERAGTLRQPMFRVFCCQVSDRRRLQWVLTKLRHLRGWAIQPRGYGMRPKPPVTNHTKMKRSAALTCHTSTCNAPRSS